HLLDCPPFPTRRSSDLRILWESSIAREFILACFEPKRTLRLVLAPLHDYSLRIKSLYLKGEIPASTQRPGLLGMTEVWRTPPLRSEEHTSELQSRFDLV